MKNTFSIRPVAKEDVPDILAIYNPLIANSPITYEEKPLSEEEMWQRISLYTKTHPWLIAECNGRLAGYAYACQHRERSAYRWCVDVSVYIHSDFQGQGLGISLYGELFSILKKQNFLQAFAIISLPNEASVRLHEKLDFKKVAEFHSVGFKLGKWHDVGWWQKEIQTPPAQPLEPIQYLKI